MEEVWKDVVAEILEKVVLEKRKTVVKELMEKVREEVVMHI